MFHKTKIYNMINITFDQKGTYQIIHLNGEFIGGAETDDLRKALTDAAKSKINNAILDLSGVTFLNSMTLGVLLSANALFNHQGGKVVLANPSSYIKSIFETTKLTLIFTIDKSIEDAVVTLEKQ